MDSVFYNRFDRHSHGEGKVHKSVGVGILVDLGKHDRLSHADCQVDAEPAIGPHQLLLPESEQQNNLKKRYRQPGRVHKRWQQFGRRTSWTATSRSKNGSETKSPRLKRHSRD